MGGEGGFVGCVPMCVCRGGGMMGVDRGGGEGSVVGVRFLLPSGVSCWLSFLSWLFVEGRLLDNSGGAVGFGGLVSMPGS